MASSELNEVKFKEYDQNKLITVGVDFSNFIGENHLVKVIDQIVESLDIKELNKLYSLKGSRAYHPKMLIKVWIYGYCQRTYTSRRLAKALRENLHFIWLSGQQTPCFKTLSSFRSIKMLGVIDRIFISVLKYLSDEGYIDLNDLYLDGTKMGANANKHSAVWKKNTLRYESKTEADIAELLKQIEELQKEEDKKYGNSDLEETGERNGITITLNPEDIKNCVKDLNEKIEEEVKKK